MNEVCTYRLRKSYRRTVDRKMGLKLIAVFMIIFAIFYTALLNHYQQTVVVKEVQFEKITKITPDVVIETTYRLETETKKPVVVATSTKVTKHFPESTYIKGAIMVNGEARGVKSITERSGCLWIACNRVISDNPFFLDDLESVITQASQFDGYSENGTYTEADYNLAVDVFERFYRELNGEPSEMVGRTIPVDYLYFVGDGEHNYFSKVQNGTPYVWGSMYISPYKN